MTVGRLQIPECVPHNNKRKAGITNAGNVPEHQRKRRTGNRFPGYFKGTSEDGGLFVPTQIPALDVSMDELSRMTYQETAYQVMSRLLTDFTEEELRTCINRAYDKKFDTDVIAPLKEADGAYYLELFPWSYNCI